MERPQRSAHDLPLETQFKTAEEAYHRLLDHGYREPDFRRFCTAYGLCVARD